MDNLRLAKDGTLLKDGVAAQNPVPLLPLPLELEADCTLRSFFAMLERYPLLQELSEFLPGVVAEAATCPPAGCRTEEIRALVLGKSLELIGFPGPVRAEYYSWLRGRGLSELSLSAAGREAALDQRQPDKEIRFIPLSRLLDTPLELGGLRHVILGDTDSRLHCQTRFTLFELVDGVAWELGFRGGSDNQR